MSITHASIIPLIGGLPLGADAGFGERTKFLMSYEPFWSNDRHIVNHYGDVPYYVLDKGERPKERVDVITSTCPCAGLSMMHNSYGDHNENNKWMPLAAEYVLGEYQPTVYFGENAPALAGNVGRNVRKSLYDIGRSHGYSLFLYRTKSLLHGSPQVRERSFYFFFKGDKLPVFERFNRPYTKIEDLLRGVKSNFQMEPINKDIPSQDPYYRFVLEEIHGGMTHREFSAQAEMGRSVRSMDIFAYIENKGYTYMDLAKWMKDKGYEREVAKCERRFNKLASGGGIMVRGVIIPKDHIGAFVGWYPTSLTHPDEDRYVTYREAMTIMGMPQDFELLDAGPKTYNHICQNVPVITATDMAAEVKATLEGKRNWVDATLAIQYNQNGRYEVVEGAKKPSLEEFFG